MGGTKWLELGDVEWPLCSWHCTRHFLDITSHLSDRFTDGILLMRKPGLTEINCFLLFSRYHSLSCLSLPFPFYMCYSLWMKLSVILLANIFFLEILFSPHLLLHKAFLWTLHNPLRLCWCQVKTAWTPNPYIFHYIPKVKNPKELLPLVIS